jgi:hypothetical protein
MEPLFIEIPPVHDEKSPRFGNQIIEDMTP